MSGGIAATTWSVGGADRIDLFWRDDVFALSHVGGDGSKWTSNRVGPLKSVVPESPDALGGIFTTVPAAVWTLAQPSVVLAPGQPLPSVPPPVHQVPEPIPTPGPHQVIAETQGGAGAGGGHPAAANAEDLGGVVIHPPIAQAHRIDVFGLGLDFALYRQWVWNGLPGNPQPLTTWERVGGSFISSPEAIAWNDGHNANRIDVFAVNGADRALHQRTAQGQGWAGDWTDLGGVFTSAASAVSWGPGRLDVFARGSDFTLRHRAFANGQWLTDWQNYGGSLACAPVAATRGANLIDIVAVAHDGSLIHRWWDGQNWSDWESRIAGPQITFVTEPAVVASGPDRFDLVVLGSDGNLYHLWWTQGAFRGPNKLSPVGPKPTLVRTPSGKLYLFGCDAFNNLIGASFNGNTWTAPGELPTGFGPTIEGRVHYPSLYRFSIDNVNAATARSAEQDTDVGSVSVTPGNWPTTTATEIFQSDILDGSNYQPQFLVLDRVAVELCEYVIFNYHIDNKANARDIDPVDAKASMETVATAAAEYALKSIGKQLSEGVMAITTIEIASLGVPVIGPLLGILANWVVGELGDFLKSGHCDGPVALEQPTLTGVDLYNETTSGTHTTSTTNPGKTSPHGCGGTSEYVVTWSIMRDK
jgi:hypothetical protein